MPNHIDNAFQNMLSPFKNMHETDFNNKLQNAHVLAMQVYGKGSKK